MFATAFDSDVADNEKIYFRFDNNPNEPRKGNLKVAVLTHDRDRRGYGIVRCFTIADRQNSFGSRFSQQEKLWIENNLQQQNVASRAGRFAWEEYKTFAWAENLGEDEEEEAIKCVKIRERNAFTGNSASLCNGFEEITRNFGIQQGFLSGLLGDLASNNADDVVDTIDDVLQYIISLYNRYNQQLNFNSKESDYHGFLSGFLMNFRYRHTAGIYLELFVGGGYTDITFLVRGVQRLMDSVPIIIELKAGQARYRYADRASVTICTCVCIVYQYRCTA